MKTLREKLLDELKAHPRGYPTWWVKERLNDGTTVAQARAEFVKLELEGLVSRRNSSNNCIVWWTPEGEAAQLQINASRFYQWALQYRDIANSLTQHGAQWKRYIKAVIDHQRRASQLSAEARKLMGVE